MKAFIAYAAVVIASALSACSDALPLSQPDNFGAAVRHNVEAQVVNPAPKPEAGPIPMNGSRAGVAMHRYEIDRVKQPKSLSTSTISIVSGGGGGGGQ